MRLFLQRIMDANWGFAEARGREGTEIDAYPQIPSADRAGMDGISGYAPIRRTGSTGLRDGHDAGGRDLRVCTAYVPWVDGISGYAPAG